MAQRKKKDQDTDPVNPWLKRLGLINDWELIGYLPTEYKDYTALSQGVNPNTPDHTKLTLSGYFLRLTKEGKAGGADRLVGDFMTGQDIVRINFFGKEEFLRRQLEGTSLITGDLLRFGKAFWLGNPKIIPQCFSGRIAPVYPVPDRVMPETIYRKLKENWQEYLFHFLAYVQKQTDDLALVGQLEALLFKAHFPTSIFEANNALLQLRKLSAKLLLKQVKAQNESRQPANSCLPDMTIMDEINSRLGLPLTDEQRGVQSSILQAMSSEHSLRGMLCGDVGTGKTAVYAGPVGGVLKKGGKAVVMLPSLVLAGQIYDELYQAFPDYRVALVTGKQRTEAIQSADLLIGTTALLFEKIDAIDLLVVDEQHRFSKKQREWLATHKTHLLEVSATPIPRSAALIKMGMLDYWRLRERHTKQTIHSYVLDGQSQAGVAFAKMKEQIAMGYQVLVVYALREDSEAVEAQSVASAFEKFNKTFPGRVMTLHGKMSEDEKVNTLQGFKNKEADVLLSTTVVEVGVTIPDLRVCLIVNAERFGMVTLHQLRGRLARRGGEGFFYMYCPNGASSDSTIRLNDVAETTDGFTLAMKDMARRGAGDLTDNATNQTGEMVALLKNIDIDIQDLEEELDK